MPAANRGGEQSCEERKLARVRTLLIEALQVQDTDQEFPELGAKLQGIIDEIDEHDNG